MGWGQLYISLETSVLCEDWIYRGNIQFLFGLILEKSVFLQIKEDYV